MSSVRLIVLALSLAVAACAASPAMQTGFSFLDPGIRTGQEQACKDAIAQVRGVPPASVQVDRTSADAHNHGIIAASVGGTSGYCRVTGDFRVLDVVF